MGVDGSEHAARAVEWCAAHATPHDEVVAAYALDVSSYTDADLGFAPVRPLPPRPTEPERAELQVKIAHEWCAPLATAGIPFCVVVMDGSPAPALIRVAAAENADLVVVGRRGRGGFVELLLGSTSHHLSHHLDRPLVIVP